MPNLATCDRAAGARLLRQRLDPDRSCCFPASQGEEAFFRPPYHHLRHPMIFYYTPSAGAVRQQAAGGRPRRTAARTRTSSSCSRPASTRCAGTTCRRTRCCGRASREVPRLPPAGLSHSSAGSIETHPGLAAGHAPIGPARIRCGRSSWASSTSASTWRPRRC
ncbi:MAG: hypothetical protein MZW92_81490 [Comamonadaceae bacterium]|nr:hypothetical protein [Comamonadaceae bacterium]